MYLCRISMSKFRSVSVHFVNGLLVAWLLGVGRHRLFIMLLSPLLIPCLFSILRIYTFSLLLTLDPATKQSSTMKVKATSHEYQRAGNTRWNGGECLLSWFTQRYRAKRNILPRLSHMFYNLLIQLSFDGLRLRLSSHVWLDRHIEMLPIEAWRVLDTEGKNPPIQMDLEPVLQDLGPKTVVCFTLFWLNKVHLDFIWIFQTALMYTSFLLHSPLVYFHLPATIGYLPWLQGPHLLKGSTLSDFLWPKDAAHPTPPVKYGINSWRPDFGAWWWLK